MQLLVCEGREDRRESERSYVGKRVTQGVKKICNRFATTCPQMTRKYPKIWEIRRFETAIESKAKTPQTVAVQGVWLGGDYRTRICDLLRVKQALYRLSYASI